MRKMLFSLFWVICFMALVYLAVLYMSNYLVKDNETLSPYYAGLAKECESKSSYSCCISSVNYMASFNYTLAEDGNCGLNMNRNLMKCIDSFSWCEPLN